MSSKGHRKASLEKLTSPEQLDRLLVVVRLPGWIALGCLGVLLFLFLMWAVFGHLPYTTTGRGIFFNPDEITLVQSEQEGVVGQVLIKEGEKVKKGDPLLYIREHSQLTVIRSPENGKILAVETLSGELVNYGKNLVWLQKEGPSGEQEAYGFFSHAEGDQIKPGMPALIAFDSVNTELYGKMIGVVKEILPFSSHSIAQSIPSHDFRAYLTQNAATFVIVATPEKSSLTPSGYKWTNKEGPPYQIESEASAHIQVVLEEKSPLSYIIPLSR